MNNAKLEIKSSDKAEQKEIKNMYNNFIQNIENIASNYGLIKLTINNVLQNNHIITQDSFRLSNNFSDGYTTIKTNAQFISSIHSGDTNRINNYQTVISLCTCLETYLLELLEFLKVNITAFKEKIKVNSIDMENFIIKAIAYIHITRKITSVFCTNDKEYLIINRPNHPYFYFNRIITMRNCMIHNQGKISIKYKNRLENSGYLIVPAEEFIKIKENEIDDIIHYFIINMEAFTKELIESYK